ncbi:uncharacterized protein ATNIH1004_010720 [Aspergillus tanneri]|uniref:FAD-binding PCMH-type domain-containing protein n=1 Tax=Aspergillus tanneri TaxID=1220188 RepID=A0A5M9M4Z8_9EURO|nr:uncharacterized protein ATNIH1004_010720 [Aspergillus tanneri]KAA8641781.1 hypothetical protein ATNIH1004_010720 [Aspergillus tanneri]
MCRPRFDQDADRSQAWPEGHDPTQRVIAASAVTTANLNNTHSLRECVARAFISGDANARIVDARNDTYTDARLGEKIQFDEFPAMIAYAKEADEVPLLVRCARKLGHKAVPRSGGHHFEAYSSLNGTLSAPAFVWVRCIWHWTNTTSPSPGGICPTVGLGGLISSGGFGMQMRALGMSAEYVLAATVVLADGRVVTASPTSHADLFWALRGGGGGTYGIVVDFTIRLLQFPRSAMVAISWNDSSVRYDVAQRFFDWAPQQTPEFTSQINVYTTNVTFLGQYLGGAEQELRELMKSSGLLDIGKPTVYIAGDCDTNNARVFGYTTYECKPGSETNPQILNVVPNPFSQFDNHPQYQYDEVPKDPNVSIAEPWARFPRIAKSFYMLKDRILPSSDLKMVIDMIDKLDPASQLWGEWHAWNITTNTHSDISFPWREQAYAHMEFQVHGSLMNATEQAGYKKWFTDLETYLRPKMGTASYSGEMDASISTNPFESYYGDNVCRLVAIKKEYDPTNFFTNPAAIQPTTPEGVSCS